MVSNSPISDFRLLTNHGNTLLLIARDPRTRLRAILQLPWISPNVKPSGSLASSSAPVI